MTQNQQTETCLYQIQHPDNKDNNPNQIEQVVSKDMNCSSEHRKSRWNNDGRSIAEKDLNSGGHIEVTHLGDTCDVHSTANCTVDQNLSYQNTNCSCSTYAQSQDMDQNEIQQRHSNCREPLLLFVDHHKFYDSFKDPFQDSFKDSFLNSYSNAYHYDDTNVYTYNTRELSYNNPSNDQRSFLAQFCN